jgi:hypothetical protein
MDRKSSVLLLTRKVVMSGTKFQLVVLVKIVSELSTTFGFAEPINTIKDPGVMKVYDSVL